MDESSIIARDERVSEMLSDPDRYFSAARRRAWSRAMSDVAADLDRRARARRNGDVRESRSRGIVSRDEV
jgi:hypothetical protein